MKAYLVTTGALFGLLCVSHVYFTVEALRMAQGSRGFAGLEAFVALVSGTLSIWAWKLLARGASKA